MMALMMVILVAFLLGMAIWGALMYEIHVPVEPPTDIEKKCTDIKERLRWLNWKLQEQKLKEENSF